MQEVGEPMIASAQEVPVKKRSVRRSLGVGVVMSTAALIVAPRAGAFESSDDRGITWAQPPHCVGPRMGLTLAVYTEFSIRFLARTVRPGGRPRG